MTSAVIFFHMLTNMSHISAIGENPADYLAKSPSFED
jgi:hypothetical protein